MKKKRGKKMQKWKNFLYLQSQLIKKGMDMI